MFKNISKIKNILRNGDVVLKSGFVLNNRALAIRSSHSDERKNAYYNTVSTSGTYDKIRPPSIGIDVSVAMIMGHYGLEANAKNVCILDAGCGTGGPAKALIKHGFQHLTLLDSSIGMLQVAKENFEKELQNGVVKDIVEAKLPSIPYADNSFDVTLFSWVLHNLVADPDGTNFHEIVDTLKETHRVLCKDGMVIIITQTPVQLQEAVWWMKILPDVTKRYSKRCPNLEQWDEIFRECNFRCIHKLCLLGKEVKGNYYQDAEGPLKKEWRDAFAYFNMLNKDEELMLEAKMKKMKNFEMLDKWMRHNDKTSELGSATLLICNAK